MKRAAVSWCGVCLVCKEKGIGVCVCTDQEKVECQVLILVLVAAGIL